MGKVSIGLRGWRFNETDVFDQSGNLRPIDDMPHDVGQRIIRLSVVMGAPCNACWLIHGDDNLDDCAGAAVVYGEPLAEVVLCDDHEVDFLYWFHEAGGEAHRGEDEFQDAFFEWFADGGRAPDEYGGLEHVDTDPESLPNPPRPATESAPSVSDPTDQIDLRNVDLDRDHPAQ